MSDFIKENNKDEVIKELDQATLKALTEIGMQAEAYAAALCPVQTGLLRNSITSAVGGQAPTKSSYSADRPNAAGNSVSGSYEGKAPAESTPYVALGSNVEYAASVELGSSTHRSPKAFLGPAILNHKDEYKKILEEELKSAK